MVAYVFKEPYRECYNSIYIYIYIYIYYCIYTSIQILPIYSTILRITYYYITCDDIYNSGDAND